ncbi:MAG: Anaerobic glycerol-3-phosphate dehydrogenase subunit C [Bacteroidetes bacterium ADurb.Bin174]|nr:MAG: Anaerobic glycerol-3-phosphate dehydrogenase subunit C [Bacteroidetes bacterium ADurb.Bin174]
MNTTKLPNFSGDFYTDNIHLALYATDASAYREYPLAVAYPKTKEDIVELVRFAGVQKVNLIPRTAGTSLAGQVVGKGIVVDVSRYMTEILELNVEEKWVRVQPGVILDELNKILAVHGLFFGPETSTSNRCMIGGMVGNNACGAHSLIYGSTRDHLLSVKTILSDGSEVEFKALSLEEFKEKCKLNSLEGKIYHQLQVALSDPYNQQEIRAQYPDPQLHRRNTGYAIDILLETEPFTQQAPPLNLAKLIAGSEGTLAFITEIKLNLVDLPLAHKAVMAVHLESLEQALQANLIALQFNPGAVELMDKNILDLTKNNLTQQKNRFFISGDPKAILIVEFARNTEDEIQKLFEQLEAALRVKNLGFHYPIIRGKDIHKIWALRKSGLGVLSNMKGDAKPVSLIEDTAVPVQHLADYIADFKQLLSEYNLSCVYHAHVGSGELHLRPILNLKLKEDVRIFRELGEKVALLVKKYKGSLSGEHGDGRLRGEFIPLMIGEHNYQLLKQIKQTWDPQGILNSGKITDTPPMDTALRYEPGKATREIKTVFSFENDMGLIRAVERCNGSGDCRKTEITGGLMCPSYMASRNEKQTTRARANILREYLTHSTQKNPFNHREIYEVLDLCLSCKGCKSECPSNVDMAKLKAEFLQHYYDANGVPLRARLIANINNINALGAKMPALTNFILQKTPLPAAIGFTKERKLPALEQQTFNSWYKQHYPKLLQKTNLQTGRKVYLFNDEFTSHYDVEIGKDTVRLLTYLGYEVIIPRHIESGRAHISKGLVRKAKKIAEKNVRLLAALIDADTPLIGIEPSSILMFRDEYIDLVDDSLRKQAKQLAQNTFLIDEFIVKEFKANNIQSTSFHTEKKTVKIHNHCYQKSLASAQSTIDMLSIPVNYQVEEIPSGCCGMAGSFGYEKEHFDLSMKVGELVLFKEIANMSEDTIIVASGTSCRTQIKDGTKRTALHPVQVLWRAVLRGPG